MPVTKSKQQCHLPHHSFDADLVSNYQARHLCCLIILIAKKKY